MARCDCSQSRPTLFLCLFLGLGGTSVTDHDPSCPTMSDSEGDFETQLLELAGVEKKRKNRQASSSKSSVPKRRKTE